MFWMKKYKKVTQAEWDEMTGLIATNHKHIKCTVDALDKAVKLTETNSRILRWHILEASIDEDVKQADSVMSMTEQDDDVRKDCGNCYFRDTSELDKPCNMCPQCGNEGKDRWTPRYDKPEA